MRIKQGKKTTKGQNAQSRKLVLWLLFGEIKSGRILEKKRMTWERQLHQNQDYFMQRGDRKKVHSIGTG